MGSCCIHILFQRFFRDGMDRVNEFEYKCRDYWDNVAIHLCGKKRRGRYENIGFIDIIRMDSTCNPDAASQPSYIIALFLTDIILIQTREFHGKDCRFATRPDGCLYLIPMDIFLRSHNWQWNALWRQALHREWL